MHGRKVLCCAEGYGDRIFRTWEECKKNVHGYSSAEYKSFKTLEEAEAYMKAEPLQKK